MKIGFRPAISLGTTTTQITKSQKFANKEIEDTASFSTQPAFTGKQKLIPMLMAASASLLILAGCGQSKQQTYMNGGMGYIPPSHNETVQSEDKINISADNSPKDAPHNKKEAMEDIKTPPAQHPYLEPKKPEKDAESDAAEEKTINEQKLYVKNQELKFLSERLYNINAELDDARRRYKTAAAELEKAEEKLKTYNRKDPNDKPPGFEADYEIYIGISKNAKELESLILSLEADKASAQAEQDEIIAEISSLGGHPNLD